MTHQLFPQLFDAMLCNPAAPTSRPLAINAWETSDDYVLEAELPGLTLDDVSVVVHDDLVTLKVAAPTAPAATDASSEPADERPTRKALRRERLPVRGSRSLRLSTPVLADDTTAVLKDGVLTVRLPKAPEHRPRTIAITGGDDA